MEKNIPFEKLSKKKQRELNTKMRGSWYGLNPVTRRPDNSKAYNRRKARKWSDDSRAVPFAIAAPGEQYPCYSYISTEIGYQPAFYHQISGVEGFLTYEKGMEKILTCSMP